MHLSSRAAEIAPSPTQTIDTLAKQMLREGIDVINLSAGEPDFTTPVRIKRAGKQAIDRDFTFYTPAAGIPELKSAVAKKYRCTYQANYTPDEVVISNGAKQALFNTYQAICNPGDEVIIQSPYWVSYPALIRLAGGIPVIVETNEANGFKLTPDLIAAHLTPRTRAISLNNPNNPTGIVYTREELENLVRFAAHHRLYLIADEVYEQIVYDDLPFTSVAAFSLNFKQHIIIVSGFSKGYAMTGWRLGYTVAPIEVTRAISLIQSHVTGNPNSIAQLAGLAALTGTQDSVRKMVNIFARRRDYMVGYLNTLPGFTCRKPAGTFYAFPDVSKVLGGNLRGKKITDTVTLSAIILREAGVAVVPGDGFGAPHHLRFSFAASPAKIEQGLNRLKTLLDDWQRD